MVLWRAVSDSSFNTALRTEERVCHRPVSPPVGFAGSSAVTSRSDEAFAFAEERSLQAVAAGRFYCGAVFAVSSIFAVSSAVALPWVTKEQPKTVVRRHFALHQDEAFAFRMAERAFSVEERTSTALTSRHSRSIRTTRCRSDQRKSVVARLHSIRTTRWRSAAPLHQDDSLAFRSAEDRPLLPRGRLCGVLRRRSPLGDEGATRDGFPHVEECSRARTCGRTSCYTLERRVKDPGG